MAVTRGKSPVILTATTDTLTPARGAAEIQSNALHWKINQIRVVNGANAGDVLLLDRVGGQTVFRHNSLAANAVTGTELGGAAWYDDLYVQSLPSGAIVEVHYK